MSLISDAQVILGGVNLGNLPDYHMVFTDGNVDANWQGASKGFIGNVAINGIQANERTSGTVPYAGIIYTNSSTLSAWQAIVTANSGQASSSLNQLSRLSGLQSNLESAFTQINSLTVTTGYSGVASTSLNGLNTQNGAGQVYIINITSGFTVSTKIQITGDANDIFILRWDSDANFSNGYNGQVKFQSGGAIVPLGGLRASNFIHVAGDIGSSGGGSNPAAPYPQGPRTDNGTGSLITGGSDFSGGGFFTGYWLTTGDPADSETSSLSNGIFVGGWYTKTTKFSMTSGTSGVYVAPGQNTLPDLQPTLSVLPAAFTVKAASGYSRLMQVVVRVNEVSRVVTPGDPIVMRIPRTSKLSFIYDPSLTSLGDFELQNSHWTFSNTNPVYWEFIYNGPFPAYGESKFGFTATFFSEGETKCMFINLIIAPGSGREINILNNLDDERIDYITN